MKDIKKGWPVVDIQWWERYDDDDDDTLFQREGIDDTVHMESLIAVDAPLRRCLGIPAPAGQWTGRLLQTTCATTLAALIKYAHLPGFYQIPSWPPCNPTAPSTNKQLLSSPTRRAYQFSDSDSELSESPVLSVLLRQSVCCCMQIMQCERASRASCELGGEQRESGSGAAWARESRRMAPTLAATDLDRSVYISVV